MKTWMTLSFQQTPLPPDPAGQRPHRTFFAQPSRANILPISGLRFMKSWCSVVVITPDFDHIKTSGNRGSTPRTSFPFALFFPSLLRLVSGSFSCHFTFSRSSTVFAVFLSVPKTRNRCGCGIRLITLLPSPWAGLNIGRYEYQMLKYLQ